MLKKVNLFVDFEVGVFPFGFVDNLKCYGPFIVVSVLVSCLSGSVSPLDTAFAENGVLHIQVMTARMFRSWTYFVWYKAKTLCNRVHISVICDGSAYLAVVFWVSSGRLVSLVFLLSLHTFQHDCI